MSDRPLTRTQVHPQEDVPQGHPKGPAVQPKDDFNCEIVPDDDIEVYDHALNGPQSPSATSVSISVDETPISKSLAQARAKSYTSNQLPTAASKCFQRPKISAHKAELTGFSFMPANFKPIAIKPSREEKPAILPLPQQCEATGFQYAAPRSVSSARTERPFAVHANEPGETSKACGNDEDQERHPSRIHPGADLTERIPTKMTHLPEASDQGHQEAEVESHRLADQCSLEDAVPQSVSKMEIDGDESETEHMESDSKQVKAAPCQQETAAADSPGQNVVDETTEGSNIDTRTPSTPYTLRQRQGQAGKSSIHASRVHKTPARHPGRHQARQLQLPVRPRHTNVSRSQPSEEDLLYILMARARESSRAMNRLAFLEEQNQQLAREQEIKDQALEQAMAAQSESAQQQDTLARALEKFKEKYYKLKKWALEANKDCEVLQTKALQFKELLGNVIKDRDEILTQLRDARSTSEAVSSRIEDIRSDVQDVTAVTQTNFSTIERMDGILVAQEEHLRSEKQRCRKLETHIVFLEHERNKRDARLQIQAKSLEETVQGFSDRVGALANRKANDDMEKSWLMECQTMFQGLLDRSMCTNSAMDGLKDTLNSMKDLFNAHTTTNSESLQSAVEALKHQLQQDISKQAAKLSLEVQSGNKEVVQARAEIARLQQKSEQVDGILEHLRHDKTAAEDREHFLQTTTSRLMEHLGGTKEAMQKQSVELRGELSALVTKWESACSQLAEGKRHIAEMEKELERAKLELAESGKSRKLLEEELDKLRDEMADAQQRAEHGHKDEVKLLELQLETFKEELDYQRRKRETAEEDVQALRLLQSDMQQSLEKAEAEKSTALKEGLSLQKKVEGLEASLTLARVSEGLLEEAKTRLEAETTEVAELKHVVKDHENLKRDLLNPQRELNAKDSELKACQDQLCELQHKSGRLEEQIREQQKLLKEKDQLQVELTASRLELVGMANLKQELEQHVASIAKLQSALAIAEKDAAEASHLKAHNSSLNDQIDTLTLDLKAAQEQNEQITTLKATAERMEDEIAALKATSEQKEVEIATLKETSEQKEDEITALKATAEQKEAEIDTLKATSEQKEDEITTLKGTAEQREAEINNLKERLELFDTQADALQSAKEELQRKEEKIATIQQQVLTLEGALSKAMLHKEMNPPESTRRVADRSGSRVGLSNNGPVVAHGFVLASSPGVGEDTACALPQQLTGASVIPETQFATLQENEQYQVESATQRPQQHDDATSELSEYTSNASDHEPGVNNIIRKKNTNMRAGRQKQKNTQPGNSQNKGHCQITGRTPSSSYGSQNDQMLLDQMAQEEDSLEEISRLLSEAGDDEDSLSWDRSASTSGRSPRPVTRSSQTRRPAMTPTPDTSPGTNTPRESTPAVMRERYPPNSAAKRKVDNDDKDTQQERTRRLKRRPANLEIRPPRSSAPKPPSGEQNASGVTLNYRKSSSVVGTNAPAPGKGQRSSKPARRGSRQDKYNNRFAA
ncbi:hypothetical protein ABEF95_002226 [Exophiala dermatitidis]